MKKIKQFFKKVKVFFVAFRHSLKSTKSEDLILVCLDKTIKSLDKGGVIMKNMPFQKARKIMGKTIFTDANLYETYLSAVAMCLYDEQIKNEGKLDFIGTDLVDRIADKVLRLIFLS